MSFFILRAKKRRGILGIHRKIYLGVIILLACMPQAFSLNVQGTVLDDAGKMLAGATVWLVEERTVQKTTTDAEGHFLFESVKCGLIELVALKEGYALGGYGTFLTSDKTMEIRLRTPGMLSFRVINNSFFPVAGARIKWLLVRGGFSIPVNRLTEQGFPSWRADKEGVVSVSCLPKGAIVQFAVGHMKYADTLVDFLDVGGKRQDVVLYEGYKLSGRVDNGKTGVADAQVILFKTGVQGERIFAETVSDPEGLYYLRASKGEYLLRASHPDYASVESVPVAISGETEEQAMDLSLARPRKIEGSVQFPDGTPSPGVWVRFSANKHVLTETHTDEDGRFCLLIGTSDGVLTILPPPGFMTDALADIPVKLGDAPSASLTPVRLRELPVISGHVAHVDSQVLISSLDLAAPLWVLSDEQGRFEIRFTDAPEKEIVHFRAEHARSLLRKDFEVNLKNPKNPEITLEAFEPDTSIRPPALDESDLTSLLGKPAPEWSCSEWFNSEPRSLESLRGKVVMLTFWAGFDTSPKGVNRMEELRALHDLFHGADNLQFIGIHDETSEKDEIKQYVERLGVAFPVGRDAEPSKTFSTYGIGAIPVTILIDKKGILRYFTVTGRLLELIKVLQTEE
ncbi:MAG TPA: carboxypeptidase regulatory-like domain-containing protein [Candidatus Hydrogenedentes bacterium]|nr:carboxypeptidase regulatory-like domain-containing protein [Candidatus Hydrogenedentota bacterium]